MHLLKALLFIAALICAGGLFGFFFTMSFSVMPGLDQTDPYMALLANQHIGHATQSSYFAVILLGLPIALILLLILQFLTHDHRGGWWLALSLLGFGGMLGVTMFFNMPLNQNLDTLELANQPDNALALWQDYSLNWQRWNLARVALSGLSLIAMGGAFRAMGREKRR